MCGSSSVTQLPVFKERKGKENMISSLKDNFMVA